LASPQKERKRSSPFKPIIAHQPKFPAIAQALNVAHFGFSQPPARKTDRPARLSTSKTCSRVKNALSQQVLDIPLSQVQTYLMIRLNILALYLKKTTAYH
jgi:hypothetical protein